LERAPERIGFFTFLWGKDWDFFPKRKVLEIYEKLGLQKGDLTGFFPFRKGLPGEGLISPQGLKPSF